MDGGVFDGSVDAAETGFVAEHSRLKLEETKVLSDFKICSNFGRGCACEGSRHAASADVVSTFTLAIWYWGEESCPAAAGDAWPEGLSRLSPPSGDMDILCRLTIAFPSPFDETSSKTRFTICLFSGEEKKNTNVKTHARLAPKKCECST